MKAVLLMLTILTADFQVVDGPFVVGEYDTMTACTDTIDTAYESYLINPDPINDMLSMWGDKAVHLKMACVGPEDVPA